MPFKYKIYKTQRVSMIRFIRVGDGEPVFDYPDLDNRGSFRKYTDDKFDRGPVVSVMKGDDIHIRVLRERIDKSAPLFAVSSDKSIMTVSLENQLPANESIVLRMTGINADGGTLPKKSWLRIHYGSPSGVVIAELGVWVFSKMNVNLTPHRVAIQDAAGTSISSGVDISAVLSKVRAIWRPYGIMITTAPIQNNPALTLATAGELQWKSEFSTLVSTYWVPNTINAYFVHQLNRPNPGVLGTGLSRKWVNGDASEPDPFPKPGIFLGDQSRSGDVRVNDTHWLANDLAHEIGHFLQLEHIDNRSPISDNADNFRDDTWARRCLMHNYNMSSFTTSKPPGSPVDVGYGGSYRGALITLKDLQDKNNSTVNHIMDPEYVTARNTISSTAGPY